MLHETLPATCNCQADFLSLALPQLDYVVKLNLEIYNYHGEATLQTETYTQTQSIY